VLLIPRRISPRRTAARYDPTWLVTFPAGSMNAEIPDGAACTNHNPSSAALIWESWSSCSAAPLRVPKLEVLVGTTMALPLRPAAWQRSRPED
jgi:hypothetical protein